MDPDKTPGKIRNDAMALATLAAMVALPFVLRAAAGKSPLSPPPMHDVGHQWISFRLFIEQSFEQGVFPLWTSRVFAGFPFAAFSHTGVFYPPGLLFLLGPYSKMVALFYPIHLYVAASGAYCLARRLGLGPLASFFAAFSYVFTGKPYYFIHFLPATCSNAWYAWTLAGALGLLKSRRRRDFIIVAASLALALLGGDVESASYGILFGAPFLAVAMRLSSDARGGRPGPFRERAAPVAKGAAALALALALGGLIAMVQALPLQELSEHFVRDQGVTFSYFTQRKLPASILGAALLPVSPEKSGGVELSEAPYFYLGVLTLALALYAGIGRRRRGALALLGLAVLALLWSTGTVELLDRVQHRLPVLGRFGSPEQSFFIGQIFLALAAAVAVESIARASKKRYGLAAAAVLAAVFFRLVAPVCGVDVLPAPWTILALAGGAVLYAAVVMPASPGKRLWLARAILLFQIVDIYSLALLYLPATDHGSFTYNRRARELVEKTGPDSRHIIVSRLGPADPNLWYHLGIGLVRASLDGWITTPPRTFAEVLALADPRAASFENGKLQRLGINSDMRDGGFIEDSSMPILDLLGLGYIVDRGVPLKFSSPYFLFDDEPRVHVRRFTDPRQELMGQDRPAGAPDVPGQGLLYREALSVPAADLETMTYRIHVNKGDVLVIGPPRIEAPSVESSCLFEAEIEDGDGRATLVRSRLGGLNLAEAEALSLGRWAGADADIHMSLACARGLVSSGTGSGGGEGAPGGAPDGLTVRWPSPRVENKDKPWTLVDRGAWPEAISLYKNREALPRAFVVTAAETIGDPAALLERMGQASRRDLSTIIFLAEGQGPRGVAGETPPGWAPPGAPIAGAGAAVTESRRPGEAIYQVLTEYDGWLFVSDQHYPGWRAFVRGEEVRVFRADHAFRAIQVRAGKSVVRMTYEPASFRVGLWSALTALAALALFLGMSIWSARRGASNRAREEGP